MTNEKQNELFDTQQHSLGHSKAPVTIVEFADFECGNCARASLVIKQLLVAYEGQVYYIFRHFPLSNIHKSADLMARAAEAAGLQGKFWEMHDLLFENQEVFSEVKVLELAQTIDLNLEVFQNDMRNKEVGLRIQRDRTVGEKRGVTSTPTFFVNGVKYKGSPDFESLSNVIESGIERKMKAA